MNCRSQDSTSPNSSVRVPGLGGQAALERGELGGEPPMSPLTTQWVACTPVGYAPNRDDRSPARCGTDRTTHLQMAIDAAGLHLTDIRQFVKLSAEEGVCLRWPTDSKVQCKLPNCLGVPL